MVAGELCGPAVSLTPEQDLNSALLAFLDQGHGQMPVVRKRENGRDEMLGLLRHEDVIAAITKRSASWRSISRPLLPAWPPQVRVNLPLSGSGPGDRSRHYFSAVVD